MFLVDLFLEAFDMSGMYVSPTAFAVLEADIEALKHQVGLLDDSVIDTSSYNSRAHIYR